MNVGELIPIISIVLGIGMVIVGIITKHRRDMHHLELQHRERMAAIEKGLDLPPEGPVPGLRPPPPPRPDRGIASGGSRYLLRGLVWLGIGLALALNPGEWPDRFHQYGWIAVAIGAAYLVYYALEGRRLDPPPPGPGGQGPFQGGTPPQ